MIRAALGTGEPVGLWALVKRAHQTVGDRQLLRLDVEQARLAERLGIAAAADILEACRSSRIR